jgi:Protein of unknown function (DUF2637)
MTASNLASRTVTGVIAAMIVATAAVGFWLSYTGLHDFAVHAGLLHGPEAWAWPASVDLFILPVRPGSRSPRCAGIRIGGVGLPRARLRCLGGG